ncbi:hypothetical protein QPM17_16165 [Marinobacter sp. TBZ242]|uniref:Lipoprotein n=1 Tax=Marinobacter azerbaijanicus TaxID=3050455 RepID=A0ABT7IES5_9GAMM|nr:hypothetical protein [Marinobacter sp. TBZ242]MDL0432677.1 hypothetical protein [Marinobacter sp. TBZ242]
MKQAVLIPLFLFLAGCASTEVTENDTGFAQSPNLDAFVGCYRNCSNPSDGSAPVCLTSILWPDVFTSEARPEAVSIQKGDGNSLIASAISEGAVLKLSRFREGEDFEFKAGLLELKREYVASGAGQPGNPFIGVVTSKTVLGLDTSGHGRINQSTAFAGTGFLIIPVAGKTLHTHKIERAPRALCGNI